MRGHDGARSRPDKATDLRPWVERHAAIAQGTLLLGMILLSLVPSMTSRPHATYVLLMPIYFVAVVAYVLWAFRKVRRAADPFRDDPNVLWAGMAGVDRIDLIQAGVTPSPPFGYGRRGTIILLTRSGVGFRPAKDRWGWRGADLSVRHIDAVTFGTVYRGGQRWPAMQLLVGSTVISMTAGRLSDALKTAVASSPLAPTVVSQEQFERLVAASAAEREPAAPDTTSRSPVGRWMLQLSVLMRDRPGRTAGMFIAAMFAGFIVFGVGVASRQVVIEGLGIVAAFGSLTLIYAARFYGLHDERRRRSQLEAEVDRQAAR